MIGVGEIGILVGEILVEGMKLFREERKKALLKSYHEAMNELNEARNAKFPNYSDVRVAKAQQRLRAFLEAYMVELKATPAAVVPK